MDQTSIFDLMYPKFKINKPIRLIEFFSGYGSQALALKYLNIPFTHHKTCEWAIKSIQAYKDIHFTEDNTNYSKDLSVEEIKDYLFNKGISSNYNEPMSEQQVNRLGEEQARIIYNNIQSTHNLVNIQQVKGKDLEIVDQDKYCYILTYSFPCQDLSLAGKGKGMEDTTTRSGMLWEVERILTECKELGTLPQCLLMENVPQVHSQDNLKAWERWLNRLEELGYKNYFQDLIATDYGIPQTRNRCFMISLLGDYSYSFPIPIKLEKKLKDMLEDQVEEKYFLSDKAINGLTNQLEKEHKPNLIDIEKDPSKPFSTITCGYMKQGHYETYLKINKNEELVGTYDYCQSDNYMQGRDRKHIGKQTSDTLLASGNHNTLLIKNATKQGYLEATDGDGVDISGRMEYHRGTVQKQMTQTLSTMGGENNGVVVKKDTENYIEWEDGKNIQMNCRAWKEDKVVATLNTGGETKTLTSELRIRKLTPRECFRLMGVKDQDFDKVKVNQSDSSLYHLAGDSIVVQCLEAIFKELL